MMKLGFFNGSSVKSLGIGEWDRALDLLIQEQTGKLGVDALYDAVAFVNRGVQIRAQTLSALPFEIVRGSTVIDESEDYQNELGWLPDPGRILSLMEQALCVVGYAYWFISRNRVKVLALKYWNPYTITPQLDKDVGLTGFERTINGKIEPFDIEDVLYVWKPDYRVEIGPPLGSPVKAAFKAAGVLDSVDEFVKLFFERGGVKGTLISAKGMNNPKERDRLKNWFREKFGRGNQSAMAVEVMQSEVADVIPIGEGIDNMDNNALTQDKRESVAVALGVPMSKLLSGTVAGLGGGGIAEQDDVNFYQDTIEPEARYIARVLNEQLLEPYGGYALRFKFDSLDVYQVDEQKRALSWATYVSGKTPMRPEVAAQMLGLEIPRDEEIPEWYASAFQELMQAPQEGSEDDSTDSDVVDEAMDQQREKQRRELEKATDLDKWCKKAVKRFEEGKPGKALDFESDWIDLATKNAIRYAIGMCVTGADVEDAFNHVQGKAVKFIPRKRTHEMPPMYEDADFDPIDEKDLESWDKAMPAFKGLLNADVINRRNYDANEEM